MRIDKLLTDHEMSVYALAQAVKERGVSEQAVYRLARANGAPKRLDLRLLAALYDVFGVEDMNDLLATGTPPVPKRPPVKHGPTAPRRRNRAA